MPKIIQPLTAREVDSLKKPGRYSVGVVSGLHLRISSTGYRAWVLRVTIKDKRRDIGLGSYPEISLAEAREIATLKRQQIRNGIDPTEERKKEKAIIKSQEKPSIHFKDAAKQFIDMKSLEWTNNKSQQQWNNTLDTYAFPIIGKMPVSDIDIDHIRKILDPIWAEKTETASRVRSRIESILNWATTSKFREGPNPAAWHGNLENIYPARSKVQKVEHHRAMPVDKIPKFWQSLNKRDGISTIALKFLILTAARSGEVRGAKWEEIDLKNKVWVIPYNRTKTKNEHRVPLCNTAIKILETTPRMLNSEYIFPAPRGGELSDSSLSAVLKRMSVHDIAVVHGFRSTFRDWAGEMTNYPRELAEQALAHTIKNKAEAAYRRGDALEKRREMMNDWDMYVTGQ